MKHRGIVYSTPSASTSYAPQASTSSYAAPSSSASTSTAVPSSSASTSTLVNGNRGTPSFGMTSSPGRSFSVASTSTQHLQPQTQQRAGSLASTTASGRYQATQKASTPSWQAPPYNSASSSTTNGAAARATAAASIPTAWPTALPPVPKSNFAGQPAVPINFKSSPFFKILMAVSPVVELRSKELLLEVVYQN